MNTRIGLVVIVAATTLGIARNTQAADATGECLATKLRASGKAALCVMKSRAKNVLGKQSNTARCADRLQVAYEKAEANSACRTAADSYTVLTRVDDSMRHIADYLGGTRFTDNLDGTITDTVTGLMWEQKTEESGCGTVSNGFYLHCVYDTYRWNSAGGAFDSIWQWLAVVNGFAGYAGLGGHHDWRIPSATELQTLLIEGGCDRVPCIDGTFDPTYPGYYWTATAVRDDYSPGAVTGAQIVSFYDGTLSTYYMGLTASVRAVRGCANGVC